ncbi:MAG TPA: helical backbone metal receptor [Candidatus Thermoplasmatota archaeon]|nr:helical backbone metal receptor [Candidatus Thermoplasmatota archaeon]
MADPRRIVSLVPSHTESLHDLGLADRVVGRTRFCIHPSPWVDAIPSIGGTKDARLDAILALSPDLVVADKDENPKALVEALQAAGVEVLWSEIDSVPDASAFLEELGGACGVPDTAHVAAQATLRTLMDVRAAAGPQPTPVFCPIWHAPWMTFDRTAYPHAMLEAAGLWNVFAHNRGPDGKAGPKYFEVHAADVAASPARWTLLPTEPFPFHRQRGRVDTAPLGAAGAAQRVRIIDGEALTWFGTRTVRGLRELAHVAAQLRDAERAG